jgi:serine/threonine-protein kinase
MTTAPEERARRAAARVGTWLRGKWRLDKVLGAGGMATVFAATHRNGLHVAVKMLHAELSALPDARRRFVNEGYAANAIGHSGVVTVLDDDVDDDGSIFLVMELLDGESVEDRREHAGGALGPREVLSIADQVLDVLALAHAKGVVHRDLKPENLFLMRDGRLKVVDFGLARLLELTGDARLTATDAGTMGTPAFLPPEQARGRWQDIDGRTDLWALGATMFTLLTGRCVHEAGTVNEALAAAITRPAPPLRTVAPKAPKALAAIVDRALAMNPIDRYQDARAMQSATRQALAALPDGDDARVDVSGPTLASARSASEIASSAPDPPTLRRDGAPSRRAWPWALGAAAALAALAAGLFALRPPHPPITAPPPSAAQPTAPAPIVSAAPPPAVSASASASAAPHPPALPPRRPSGPAPSAAPAASADDPLDRRH